MRPTSPALPASDFSGLKGRFAAWFLTSPLRRLLEWKMGKPEARIFALLALQGDEQVLDAGCGSGFHTLLVAQRVPRGRVVATDVSVEMLDKLRANAKAKGLSERIEPRLADNLALDLADGSMDRALSVAAWHHLADPQRAGSELARTLSPGGRVVVVDLEVLPGTKAVHGLKGHDRAFEPQTLRTILERAGLVEVQVERVGRWLIGSGDKPPAPLKAL